MRRFITINARRMSRAGLIAIICLSATQAHAQKRDNLTHAETDLIRFHQEIDKRIEVFIKAADRRFAIINGTAQPSTTKLLKDEPAWGDLPLRTHAAPLNEFTGI